MPISHYNRSFGGKKGSAAKALASMRGEYGEKKGTSVFYATANKRGGRASVKRKRRHRRR